MKTPLHFVGRPKQVPSKYRIFVRLRIWNVGQSVARQCKGKLVAIADREIDNIFTDFDPVKLHWVGNDETILVPGGQQVRLKTSVDVNKGEYEYLDLLFIPNDRMNIEINAIDRFGSVNRGIRLTHPPGDYSYYVTIYAENAEPDSTIFKLSWMGAFNNILLSRGTEADVRRFQKLLRL